MSANQVVFGWNFAVKPHRYYCLLQRKPWVIGPIRTLEGELGGNPCGPISRQQRLVRASWRHDRGRQQLALVDQDVATVVKALTG